MTLLHSDRWPARPMPQVPWGWFAFHCPCCGRPPLGKDGLLLLGPPMPLMKGLIPLAVVICPACLASRPEQVRRQASDLALRQLIWESRACLN